MNEVKPLYNCTQDAFYEIERRILVSLTEDQPDFVAKSTNYTAAYVTMVKGLRTTAMSFPNEDQRNSTHESTRNLLPGLTEPVKLNFRALQGYIRAGWPTEDPNPRYEEAGLLKYNAIRGSNWEAVESLQQMMLDFVAVPGNLAKITTPGGMPVGFVAQLGTDYTPFETKFQLFTATLDTTTLRNAKIAADNVLYKETTSFMKFGREVVYPKDKGKKERYTWTIIEQQVDPHFSGMHVKTMNGALDVPEVGVTLIWKPVGKPAVEWTTEENGIGEKELEAEKGTLTAKKVGMVDLVQEFELSPGRKKRVNLTLTPVQNPN